MNYQKPAPSLTIGQEIFEQVEDGVITVAEGKVKAYALCAFHSGREYWFKDDSSIKFKFDK